MLLHEGAGPQTLLQVGCRVVIHLGAAWHGLYNSGFIFMAVCSVVFSRAGPQRDASAGGLQGVNHLGAAGHGLFQALYNFSVVRGRRMTLLQVSCRVW